MHMFSYQVQLLQCLLVTWRLHRLFKQLEGIESKLRLLVFNGCLDSCRANFKTQIRMREDIIKSQRERGRSGRRKEGKEREKKKDINKVYYAFKSPVVILSLCFTNWSNIESLRKRPAKWKCSELAKPTKERENQVHIDTAVTVAVLLTYSIECFLPVTRPVPLQIRLSQ